MECYCHLRNIQDLFSDGKTPRERRFEEHSIGPIKPFGAKVEYHPISAKDQARLHQVGKKVLSGIQAFFFKGCVLYAVRGSWKGFFSAADVEELLENDSSEVYLRILETTVPLPKGGDNFIFTFVIRSEKLAGNLSEIRKSDRLLKDIEKGEEHRGDLQGETDEPDSADQQEQDEWEAKHDFWSISVGFSYGHHEQERQKCMFQKRVFWRCQADAHFGRIARLSD